MKLLTFLIILFTCFTLGLSGQAEKVKTKAIGIYFKSGVAKKVYKNENATSKLKPAISANVAYHLDLASKIQFRAGIGVSLVFIDEMDYSPTFAADFDTLSGTIKSVNSFFIQKSRSVDLILPVNIRYKLVGDSNHFYISPGLTLIQSLIFEKDLYLGESGLPDRKLDQGDFYSHRKTKFAFTVEGGYEFNVRGNRKMNISISAMRNLSSENQGISSALRNIIDGKLIEFNIGIGIII